MLFLNNTKIPGHDQRISVGFTLASEDMSGNSSATAKAETGDKGKEVTVTTYIKFDNPDELALITGLAESKDSYGERTLYSINEPTCKAMKLRQVRFNANFNVRPDNTAHQWAVSFNLIEYRSVAEKKQERKIKQSVAVQSATGTSTAEQGGNSSGFEAGLKKLDAYLGAN